MTSRPIVASKPKFIWSLALALCLVPTGYAAQQTGTSGRQQTAPPVTTPEQTPGNSSSKDKSKPETHITGQQAQQLFSLVDQLLKFSSDETGLPIKSEVKRQ